MAAPSREVGRYRLYGTLGKGGMATVHLGRVHGAMGFSRTVAIKRLLSHLTNDLEFVSMFIDEGRIAARIHHPNVVSTLDVVRAADDLFIVMEYVPGDSLVKLMGYGRVAGERIPVAIAVGIINGVLDGLHAAHTATGEDGSPLHVVHRDVSPDNILVGIDGVPRLLDFGVAKARAKLHTTRHGSIKGKLRYMAPEAFAGQDPSPQADIFSASVVLWELLTSERLFSGKNEAATVGQILEGTVPKPGSLVSQIPPALDEVVLKGLSREPSDRFESARHMARALRATGVSAHPDEIGDWVRRLAADALAKRATLVREVESGSTTFIFDVNPRDDADPAATDTHVVTHTVQPGSPGVVSSGQDPKLSQADGARAPLWGRVPWAAAGLTAAVLLGSALFVTNRNPTAQREIVHSISRALPSAPHSASSLPSSSSGVSLKRKPVPRARVPKAKPSAPSTKAPDRTCSPPWYEDAKGIRRVKRHCL